MDVLQKVAEEARTLASVQSLNEAMPSLLLIVLLLAMWQIGRRAGKKPGFDWGDMLRDANCKVSSTRVFAMVALAASTWGFMVLVLRTNTGLNEWFFAVFLGVWSGQAVVTKALDAYIVMKGGNLQSTKNFQDTQQLPVPEEEAR